MLQCYNCEPGFFCESGNEPALCPAGMYCIGSRGNDTDFDKRDPEEKPSLCPIGSYSNHTGLKSIDECTPCDEGSYCPTEGLTSPKGMITIFLVIFVYTVYEYYFINLKCFV